MCAGNSERPAVGLRGINCIMQRFTIIHELDKKCVLFWCVECFDGRAVQKTGARYLI